MMSKNDISAYMSEWMRDREESPIVMSSRIRLARNLENHVHPLMFLSEQDGFRIINEVQDALPDLAVQRLDAMDQQSKYNLSRNILLVQN